MISRALVLLTAALTMQACAVHDVHRLRPAQAETQLVAGDPVIVALKSGKNYKGIVVSTDVTRLITKTGTYLWKDIDHITKKEVDWVGTTLGYVLLHVVVVGAAYLYVESWD
jgi:hypothetical protein